MPDTTDRRRELGEAARLDDRARTLVDDLSDAAVAQLLDAWHEATSRQDREVDAAIEGSLSLLPRLLRTRVLKILTRARA